MKVLVISSGIPTEKYPLQGIFEWDQAKALALEGNDVVFIAIDLRSVRRWRKWGVSRGRKDGIDYYVFNFPMGRVPLKYLCKVGEKCLRYLYRKSELERGRPDVIHAHFTEMGCIASRLARKENIPYVVTEHSSKMHRFKIEEDLRKCALEAYSNAKEVIAVGTSLSKSILKHTGLHSVVVPNIIDTKLFINCKKQPHQGFVLVTTSNLIPLKRTWQILQAMAMLDCNKMDCRLTIIGDGPERATVEYWAQQLNLTDRVTLAGYQSRENIAHLYETSDCFILVSSSETFGVAYVEALAAGLPIIATKCGGPEDFVDDSNGILVEVDNIKQIADAILKIYTNINNYKEEDLKNFVKDRFSPNVVAKKLIEVYNSLG